MSKQTKKEDELPTRSFPNIHKRFDEGMRKAVERYVDGFHRAGWQPNDKLNRAVAERVSQEIAANVRREIEETYKYNVEVIKQAHRKRERELRNEIRREGRSWMIPLFFIIALGFGLLAWYHLSHQNPIWLLYAPASVIFLIMALTLSAIFRR
jgi:Flp pilus assembly protein TadB